MRGRAGMRGACKGGLQRLGLVLVAVVVMGRDGWAGTLGGLWVGRLSSAGAPS